MRRASIPKLAFDVRLTRHSRVMGGDVDAFFAERGDQFERRARGVVGTRLERKAEDGHATGAAFLTRLIACSICSRFDVSRFSIIDSDTRALGDMPHGANFLCRQEPP